MERDTRFDRQRGAGRFGSFISLAIFLAFLYAGWNVAPVYIQHYALVDKTNELARAPKWNHPDDRIYDLLMKYVREERLEAHFNRGRLLDRAARAADRS